ncbi:MAG: hypothetical protein JWM47_578 [Acidimicrobiales bacterium]|nr:hypothetical protein [Acidimicrobiales bacterium]
MQGQVKNRLTARAAVLLALSGVAIAAPAIATATGAAVRSASTTVSYGYTGGAQEWIVPVGVTSATFALSGSNGGSYFQVPAGKGGTATATLAVTPGTTIEVNVGGISFNGGGSGFAPSGSGADGGGATDIRIGGSSLFDRKLVAGGAGGSDNRNVGGDGGGLVGGGRGGTQTEGGPGFITEAGSFGQGGNSDGGGGGGGGGWFGGGTAYGGNGQSGGGSGYGPDGTVFVTGGNETPGGLGSATITYTPVQAPVGTTTATKGTYVSGEKVSVIAAIPTKTKTVRATGSVTFDVDGTPVTVAVNSAGKAVFTSTTLALGDHTVSGFYNGDAKYAAGPTGSASLTIVKGNTNTFMTSFKEPVASGTRTRVQATAKKVAPAGGVVNGTMSFVADNGTDPATAVTLPTNNSGTALWQPLLADGTWTITSTYSGNATYNGSSKAVTVHVGPVSQVDQVSPRSGSYGGYSVNEVFTIGQTFTAGRTGELERIDMYLAPLSTVSDLQVSIQQLSGGRPSGVPMASTVLPAATTSPGLTSVMFSAPASVLAGTTYAIVLELAPGDNSGTWSADAGPNGYNGLFANRIFGNWYDSSGTELFFTTFVK